MPKAPEPSSSPGGGHRKTLSTTLSGLFLTLTVRASVASSANEIGEVVEFHSVHLLKYSFEVLTLQIKIVNKK